MTRDEPRSGPLASMLAEAGAEVVHVRATRRQPLQVAPRRADWVVWSSAFAVHSCRPHTWGDHHAAVGPGTADALASEGIEADMVAGPTSTHLAEALAAMLTEPTSMVYPCSSLTDDRVEVRLSEHGHQVERIPVYDTIPADPTTVRDALSRQYDVMTFTSPSAVHSVTEALAETPVVPAAVIGPTTLAACVGAGWAGPIWVASEPNLATLAADLIAEWNSLRTDEL